MKIRVRGYSGKTLVLDEQIDTENEDLETLAKRHITRIVDYPKHMLEVEFLDEPDVNQRFFRFGTDPSRMVMPILTKP